MERRQRPLAATKRYYTMTPPPGHPEAVKQGCTCNPELNHHGKGFSGVKEVYGIGKECPLHSKPKGMVCTCDPDSTASLQCPLHWEQRLDYERSKDRAGLL